MSLHPPTKHLERFMTGELPPEENRSVVRHLIAGCSECGKTTSRLWEVLITGSQAPRPEPEEYDAAFDRAWIRATETYDQLQREREAAPARRKELLELTPPRQKLRIRNDRRFQTLALCEALIEASERTIFDDVVTACNLAELAREVTAHLDASRYGAAFVADAQADAWENTADVLVTSSDYEGAERALRTARSWLDNGTGNPTKKAKYLDSLAKLLTERGLGGESLLIYKELEAIYSKLGDQHRLGHVQLKKAFAFHKMRRFERAIQLLTRALELLDPARDPRHQVNALHNLVAALIEAGRPEEADQHMPKLRRLYAAQGGRLSLLRFRWIEGRLAYAKGDLDAAKHHFTDVRNAFIELEIGIDVARASLDLAEVLWLKGESQEARSRLQEAIPILGALGVQAEAVAALAFLEHAVRVETASAELIRQVAAFVQRAHSDPSVRFRPGQLGAEVNPQTES